MRLVLSTLLCGSFLAGPALAAEPVERRLHPTTVEASSFLWNDFNKFQENYSPLYLADGDPATAWVEGAKGTGAGEWVRLKVTPMEGATRVRLRLRNGYQKTPRLFRANARIQALNVKVLPGGATQAATLKDEEGWQEITVPLPSQKVEAVELRVDAVYPGDKYEDLCLSDAEVYVTASTPDNPAFEKSKLQHILQWRRERAEAAAAFKGAAAKSMPVAAQYRVTKDDRKSADIDVWTACDKAGPDCRIRASLEAARARTSDRYHEALDRALAAAKAGYADFHPVQALPTDKRRLPAVDGLCVAEVGWVNDGPNCEEGAVVPLGGLIGWLSRDTVGTFALADAPTFADALAVKPAACKRQNPTTFAWARTEKDATGREVVRDLLLVQCGLVDQRGGAEPEAEAQLLSYGADGRLALAAGEGYATLFDWRDGDAGPVIDGGEALNGYFDLFGTWRGATPVAAK